MIYAFVGAGGKTSLIRAYAGAYLAQGKRVFVTTSTRMYAETDTLLTDDADVILRELEEKRYVMAGIRDGRKIKALSHETYLRICERADVVLIEADGSKHLPIKFPGEKEPVIWENVDEIVVVCGMHALGRKLSEAAHRPELVKACLGISEDTVIEPAHMQTLVQKGYTEPLNRKFPEKRITVIPYYDEKLCHGPGMPDRQYVKAAVQMLSGMNLKSEDTGN